jgi:hypothetical protein
MSGYISPPIKGLIQVIAKAVADEYRKEINQSKANPSESRNLRQIQQR